MTGRVGAFAVDLTTGRELVSYRANEPFLIASLTKILTGGAVLEALGAEATLATSLYADAKPNEDGIVYGDVYVVGGGDPTLGDEAHVEEYYGGSGTTLTHLSAALRAAGVRRIEGQLIGDGSLFQTDAAFDGWYPALCMNRMKSDDAALDAVTALRTQLIDDGVTVVGKAASGKRSAESTVELARVSSPSLLDLARQAGHESDNFISEVLTKVLSARASQGSPATSAAGVQRIEEHAANHGLRIDLTNGSGIRIPGPGRAVGNRSTPRMIVDYLSAVRASPCFQDLLTTLPRAGQDGTLSARMRNTQAATTIRAKTGTLTRERRPLIDALAGYCETEDSFVAFTFIEARAESRYLARSSLDRMAEALANHIT